MANRNGKTILVVDDEPDVRTFFETALTEAGFDVVMAGNGDQALEAIAKKTPDLISLDLVMPKKSGVKFFHELRKKKEWASIPVLIVTAHASDEFGNKDLEQIMADSTMSGPGVYLEKPVTPYNYVRNIKKMLNMQFDDEDETAALKQDLAKKLREADSDTLKKMLDMLKKE